MLVSLHPTLSWFCLLCCHWIFVLVHFSSLEDCKLWTSVSYRYSSHYVWLNVPSTTISWNFKLYLTLMASPSLSSLPLLAIVLIHCSGQIRLDHIYTVSFISTPPATYGLIFFIWSLNSSSFPCTTCPSAFAYSTLICYETECFSLYSCIWQLSTFNCPVCQHFTQTLLFISQMCM